LQLVRDLVFEASRSLSELSERVVADLSVLRGTEDWQRWLSAVHGSEQGHQEVLTALAGQGISAEAYQEVRARLDAGREAERAIVRVAETLGRLQEAAREAWEAVVGWHMDRHARREGLFEDAAEESRVLRFDLKPFGNHASWVSSVRRLLNLRVDGFLNEVPATARALFEHESEGEMASALAQWRQGLVDGDLHFLSERPGITPRWLSRLQELDPDIRLRLATEMPDDLAAMYFKQEKAGEGDDQWQSVSDGSPGQRTAAMLALVLHLGQEPLVLDQPEDDLDTEWLSQLVVRELRHSRWQRQLIVVTHNANIPVNGDADRVVVLQNVGGSISIRQCAASDCLGVHSNPIEVSCVRRDIQNIMEGGVESFVRRERKYNNELSTYRLAMVESPV
jgi:hypothetical protein